VTTLGTGLDVSPLALGASTFGWTSDETASRQVLDSFLEAGGIRQYMVALTSMMAFTRLELTGGQRSALDEVSARVPRP
jgi:hypothetical protein